MRKIPQPVSYNLTWMGSTIFAKQHKNEKMVRGGSTTSVVTVGSLSAFFHALIVLRVFFKKEEEKTKLKNQNKTPLPHWVQLHLLKNFPSLWTVG